MKYKNVINWLKNNGYDMTDDRYELAADNLNDHTMLDLVELLEDYGKFVLSDEYKHCLKNKLYDNRRTRRKV